MKKTLVVLAHPAIEKKSIASHNMIYVPGVYNKKEEVEQRAGEHVRRLDDYSCKLG
jgi:hypothetical protein